MARFGLYPRTSYAIDTALDLGAARDAIERRVSTSFMDDLDDKPFTGAMTVDGAKLRHRRPWRNDMRPVLVVRFDDAPGGSARTRVRVHARMTRASEFMFLLVASFPVAMATWGWRGDPRVLIAPAVMLAVLWAFASAGFWLDGNGTRRMLERLLAEGPTPVPRSRADGERARRGAGAQR